MSRLTVFALVLALTQPVWADEDRTPEEAYDQGKEYYSSLSEEEQRQLDLSCAIAMTGLQMQLYPVEVAKETLKFMRESHCSYVNGLNTALWQRHVQRFLEGDIDL